ncbi:MAG: hypothetical protein ACYC2K_00215 [Gemmatimonadales bacterium]
MPRHRKRSTHGAAGYWAALAAGLLLGCGAETSTPRFDAGNETVTLPVESERLAAKQPMRVRQPGAFTAPPVYESSGLVRSRTHPGLLWTLNDSGNPPTLFLIDTLAQNPGFVTLTNGRNEDWEALSSGPCGEAWCLYIADIGDNRSIRPSVRIYRVVEPTPDDVANRQAAVRDSLVVRYANGPEDAEAMVVTPGGDIAIFTKGGRGVSTVYWIAASAWAGDSALAEPVGRLPFRTSILLFLLSRLVTDAALSPDGQQLFVRSYNTVFRFGTGQASDRLPMQLEAACDVGGLDPQGEGLAWWDDKTLVMSSETTRLAPAPVTLLECAG